MNKFEAKFKNIYAPVDVIIPFHGNYALVAECLESLIRKTLGVAYSITLVDDASPNKEFMKDLEKRKLKGLPIQYIRLEEQKGFSAALKVGYEATNKDWVCFLHSDTRIEETDWLINMLQTMKTHKDEGVKLVSAKTNDGGTGSFDPSIIGTSQKTADVIVENPLPLICALMHRELFHHAGGFLKEYQCSFADDELFWRLKILGLKEMVCGSSFVYHHGGATMKEFLKNAKTKETVNANQKQFVEDIREFARKERRLFSSAV